MSSLTPNQPPPTENGERYCSPDELLIQFEALGKKTEKRWEREHPQVPDYKQPERIGGIFPLSTGGTADFTWQKNPRLFRPEHWLPSGSLVIGSDQADGQHSDLFAVGRYIGEHCQPLVRLFGCVGLRQVETAWQLMDSKRLRELHDALEEIEQALDTPDQPVVWHPSAP